uniref:Large ribosomal subunit protein bL20c n=1 Tax=Incarvillea sinensis TaxID=291312 RepID=A0A866VZA4_9LAMI|nr:ribosomal protein L20 [Incarvillea sinensis]QOE76735.1 ribosomal protein L20 [Incarvillea sinensis]
MVSADRDRRKQKRNFRSLWITRINGAIREMKLFFNYSKWIHHLYTAQLLINRKMLAQMARFNPQCLFMVSKKIAYSEL